MFDPRQSISCRTLGDCQRQVAVPYAVSRIWTTPQMVAAQSRVSDAMATLARCPVSSCEPGDPTANMANCV